ncbi:MAG: TVP38/TMEM64 family protein, partial [Bacillaceae bacterium]|nr:TVP38/TMEM64 family protein [Bacillaceae bacterium]
MRQRVLKSQNISMKQTMVLRMLPFIHFHLLSLYVLEQTDSFEEYVKYSFLGLIAPAILFTMFGHIVINLSVTSSLLLLVLISVVFFFLKKIED